MTRRPAMPSVPAAGAPSAPRKFLRVKDVAERMAVSTRTVQAWIASGRLKRYLFARRTLRIDEADVEALIREAACAPLGPTGGGHA